MGLFGKKPEGKSRSVRDEETSEHRTDTPAQGDYSLADLIPEVASSPAAAKAVADIIAISHWTCSSCQRANSGTIVCQQCGEPLSDEEFLAPLRTIASLTAAQEGTAPMPANAAIPDGDSVSQEAVVQGWNCPYCGQTNQEDFCKSCGAQKP